MACTERAAACREATEGYILIDSPGPREAKGIATADRRGRECRRILLDEKAGAGLVRAVRFNQASPNCHPAEEKESRANKKVKLKLSVGKFTAVLSLMVPELSKPTEYVLCVRP